MWRLCLLPFVCVSACVVNVFGDEQNINSSFSQSQFLDILFNGALDKELEIIDEQKAELAEIRRSRQAAIHDGLKRIQESQDRSGHGNAPRSLIDVKADVDRTAMESVAKILLPHQVRRWKRVAMHLIYHGDKARALLSADTAHELGLSDEQRARLKRMFSDGEAELKEAEARIRRDREARMLKELTREQRAVWDEVFGELPRSGKR